MYDEQVFREALVLIGQGHLNDAHKFLVVHKQELQRIDAASFAVLLADVSLQRGDLSSARHISEKVLRDNEAASVRAYAHRLLAEVHANELDFEQSLESYAAARSFFRAGVSEVIKASVELSFWSWFAGVLPFETTESEFSAVRRAVIRTGDAHYFSELRLCAARVEARKGSLIEAERHWEYARRLLQREPNLKLTAQMYVDGCMISLLSGDVRTALERAGAAQEAAEASGYYRAAIGSLINRAHILHVMGDLTNARALAEKAVSGANGHTQLRVAALDCLANVLLAQGDVTEAEAAFEAIGRLRPKHGTRLALHWDVLSELSSRLVLAKVRGRSDEEVALVNEGLRTATHSHDQTWLLRMQLSLAELRLDCGEAEGAVAPLSAAAAYPFPSPELLARTAAVRALAAFRSGDRRAAAAAYSRGSRIAKAIENPALLNELKNDCADLEETCAIPSLDDSVALIELGGYPHVLAREAFALLELTGAAEALGLVARTERGVRCISAARWTDQEALAAAAQPEQHLHIRCGVHRDESWEIVAALKPTLNDRCAGIAVRKLVDTAVTLDRYRREEKQRAALWPADTLETDGGLWVSEQMTELLSIARRSEYQCPLSCLGTQSRPSSRDGDGR